MAQYTPGPWAYEQLSGEPNATYCIISTTSKARNNTGFNADNVIVDPELGINCKGDACLIAEAPELLKMLKHAVRYHDQLSATDIAMMEAVIAKAECRS